MRSQLVQQSRTVSRRAVIPSLVATAIGGSATAASVFQRKPRLLIVGEDEWQIALLLASRTRVLILNGTLSQEAVSAIPLLLSVMRQRIDAVIGSSAALSFLPGGFSQRWLVRRFIPTPTGAETSSEMTIPDQVLCMPGGVRVDISVSRRSAWAETPSRDDRSSGCLVTISGAGNIVAIAGDLETIADLGPSLTTVAIAPIGDIGQLARKLLVPTICVNADQVRAQGVEFRSNEPDMLEARSLVKIFAEDVAEFCLLDDGITIPAWRQVFDSA